MLGKVFIACAIILIAALLSTPQAHSQQTSAVVRIGFLTPISRPESEDAFRQELHRLGYVDGKNIVVEYRSAQGDFERLPALAAELVNLKVDVIVTAVSQASLAAKKATTSIPIVMVAVGDPVSSGLVANLARPGGNVTGTSSVSTQVIAKQLEVLHELLPAATRVATLWNPANTTFQQQLLAEAKSTAEKLRIQLQLVEARTPQEIDRAFVSISRAKSDAILVLVDPIFVSRAKQVADLAMEYRIPAVSGVRALAEAGVVATYGIDVADSYRRAASYVDRILKGAKPADLPIEQPTKLELVINAKTARALGIAIPKALAARADQVID